MCAAMAADLQPPLLSAGTPQLPARAAATCGTDFQLNGSLTADSRDTCSTTAAPLLPYHLLNQSRLHDRADVSALLPVHTYQPFCLGLQVIIHACLGPADLQRNCSILQLSCKPRAA
jgi:hypothetical protein